MPASFRDFNPYMSEREYEDFLDQYMPTGETSYEVGGEKKHFQLDRFKVAPKKWLVRAMELQGPGGEPKAQDPLYKVLGIGPRLRSKPEYSTVTMESSTGSSYVGLIGREIYQEQENPDLLRGGATVRDNPAATAREYMLAPFFVNKAFASGIQGKSAHVLSHGMPEAKLAGGMMTIPRGSLSDAAMQSWGQRTVHALSPQIENRRDAVLNFARGIRPDALPAGLANRYEQFAGYVPYSDNDNILRWREASQSHPITDSGNFYFGMFGGPAKLGHLNVTRSERERTSLMRRNEQGYLEKAVPEPITQRGQEGYRLPNVSMGKGTPYGNIVNQGILTTAGTPDSGAMTTYGQGVRERENLIGPVFDTRQTKTLRPIDYTAMRNETTFDWGIFDKEWYEDDQGERQFRWTKRTDAEGNAIPIVGYALKPNQRQTIGIQRTKIRGTGEVIESPIEVGGQPRTTVITGMPTLHLQGYYNPSQNQFSTAPGVSPSRDRPDDRTEAIPIPRSDRQTFLRNMGGGGVEYGAINGQTVSVPIATEQFYSQKTGGIKQIEKASYIDKLPMIETMGGRRAVRGITGEEKSPISQFVEGPLGTMVEPQLKSLVTDLYPEKTASQMRDIIGGVFSQQRKLQAEVAAGRMTKEEYAKQHPQVDLADLSNVYAQTTPGKENIQPWEFANDMFQRFNLLAMSSPEHTLKNYDYALVDKPQYFDYLEIAEGWQPYLQATLNESVDLAQKANPDQISPELAQRMKKEHYQFEPADTPGRLKWKIRMTGKWGTQASAPVTEHMGRGNPSLGIEGMASARLQNPVIAKAIPEMQEHLMSPGQKAWQTLDKWYSFQSASENVLGANLPPGFENINYTSVSRSQADTLLSRLKALPPEEANFEGWERVTREVLGDDVKDILRMDFGNRPSIPIPSVVGAASEYDMDEYGMQVPVSGSAYHYPQAYGDILSGFDYQSSKGAERLFNNISNVLETSDERLKAQQKNILPGMSGKLGAAGGILPPGYSIISQEQMRASIISTAKALDYPVLKQGREAIDRFVDKSITNIEKQGGLAQYITSDPTYVRGGALQPSMTVTPKIARERFGVNIPDNATIKDGKMGAGSLTNWGTPVLAQYEVHSIGKDFDADEAKRLGILDESPLHSAMGWQDRLLYDYNREKSGRSLLTPGADFEDMMSRDVLTRQQEAFARIGNEPLGGAFNAQIDDMSKQVGTAWSTALFQDFINDSKYKERVSQQEAVEGGLADFDVQGEMGKSYNIRRLMESTVTAAYGSGKWTPKDIAGMYDDISASYKLSLEKGPGGPPIREYENIINSIFPYYRSEKDYGFGFIKRDMSGGEGFAMMEGFNFNDRRLFDYQRQAVLSDVSSGFLTEQGAVGFFARSGEERKSLISRLESETPGEIIDSLWGTEGYDFSESMWGQMQQSSLEDKLKGVTKQPYKLKGSSIYAGKTALSVLGEAQANIGGKQYPLKDLPQSVQMAPLLQQFQTRRLPFIDAQKRARIEEHIMGIESQGLEVPSLLQTARESLDTPAAYHVLSMANSINETVGQREPHGLSPRSVENAKFDSLFGNVFDNFRVSPSQIPNLADNLRYSPNARRDAVAKAAFGINDLTGYIPEERERRDFYGDKGDKFEEAMAEGFIGKTGLQNALRPKFSTPMQDTVFGNIHGKPDVVGVNPETGALTIADLKWSAKKETALKKATDQKQYGPQLQGYAEIMRAMASKGKEQFTQDLFSMMGAKGSDQQSNLRGVAESWYTAITNVGIETGIASGFTNEQTQGHEWISPEAPFSSFGMYSPEQGAETAAALQQTYQNIGTQDFIRGVAGELAALPQEIFENFPKRSQQLIQQALGTSRPITSQKSVPLQPITPKVPKTQTGGGGRGGGNIPYVPTATDTPDPSGGRGRNPRVRGYSPPGSIGNPNPPRGGSPGGPTNPVIENLKNIPPDELKWLDFWNNATVQEMAQVLPAMFEGLMGGGAQDNSRFYGDRTTPEEVYYGSYLGGVQAYEEMDRVKASAAALPNITAQNLQSGLIAAGFGDEEIGYVPAGDGNWTTTDGQPANLLEEVIPSMKATLKAEAPGLYEGAMQKPRAIAKKTMDLHKSIKKGVVASEKVGGDLGDRINQSTLSEMKSIVSAEYISFAESISGEKAEKGITSVKKTEDVQNQNIETFDRVLKVFDELADKGAALNEQFDEMKKSTKGLTEEQIEQRKKMEVEFEAKSGETKKARVAVEKARQLAFDQDALPLETRSKIASEGTRSVLQAISGEEQMQKMVDGEGQAGGGGIGAFSKSLRSLFGGWGMMYMGRLAKMGFGVWEKQYGASEQYDVSSLQAARRMYGGGFGEGVAPLAYAQQSARIRGGGGIYGDIARAGTWVDDYSDVTSPAMGGLGAGLLAHWAGPTLFPALGTVAKGATGLAAIPPIMPIAAGLAAATAGTLYVANQARNIQNYDETIAMAAAQGVSGKPLASWIKMSGIRVADRAAQMGEQESAGMRFGNLASQWMIGNLGQGSINPLQGQSEPGSGTERKKKYEAFINRIISGDMTVGELKDLEKQMGEEEFFYFTKALGGSDAKPLDQIQAATRQMSAYSLLNATDDSAQVLDIMLPAGLDIEAGGAGMQMAANVHSMIGQVSTDGTLQQTGAIISSLPSVQQQKIAKSLSLMERTPGALREFYGMDREQFLQIASGAEAPSWRGDKMSIKGLAKSGLYADIEGGQWEDYFLQARGVQEKLRQQGVTWEFDETQFAKNKNWTTEQESAFKEDLLFRNMQAGTIESFAQMGMSYEAASQMTQAFEETGMAGVQFMQRLQSFDPRAYGQLYNSLAGQPGRREGLSQTQTIASLANYDMWTGEPTTQGMFATSMAGPSKFHSQPILGYQNAQASALANAAGIWGGNWQQSEAARAAVYGVNKETGQVYDSFQPESMQGQIAQGQLGWAYDRLYKSYEASKASLGASYAQIALQEEYMPKFWDIQDRQRALGHRQQLWQFEQQEWSLGFSERQMEMGDRQWQERRGLQRRQDLTQRQWTMEDWGYQDLTRSLQWGWKQEDSAESVRFMTGRQRKLAERGMERETTMFNLESGQIDTQRDRQKEIWALQDERFDMEARHHKEQLQMQEESLAKQREQLEMQKQFYEERRQLEEESIALSREYQMKQLELQKAALGAQAQQIENQFEINKKALDLQGYQDETLDKAKQAQQESAVFFDNMIRGLGNLANAWDMLVDAMVEKMENPDNPIYFNPPTNDDGGDGGLGEWKPELQEGGDFFAGANFVAGERGAEIVRPGTIGSVVNQYDIAKVLGQEDKWDSKSVFYPTQRGGVAGQGPGTINVYVGNEKLASFVLNTVKKDLEIT